MFFYTLKPLQLSVPSRILHIRALCAGLFHVKQNLIYVLDSLQRFGDSEWGVYEDKVAHELTAGTILLAGILDGLVLCDLFHNSPERSTSFCTTAFQRPDLRKIQQSINDLKSISESPPSDTPSQNPPSDTPSENPPSQNPPSQNHPSDTPSESPPCESRCAGSRAATFWTISDFWKLYYPYLPRPSNFNKVRDFSLNLGDGHLTGPILHDLIVPAFNGACEIARAIAAEEGLECQYIARGIYPPNPLFSGGFL